MVSLSSPAKADKKIKLMPPRAAHIYSRPIRFAETDAAGIAHFSRLLVIVEEAAHDFFHVRGIPVFDAATAWPVVSLQTNYKSPCRFGEAISIGLSLERLGTSSVTILFEAHKPDRHLVLHW
jgi:YbgC/YbaW family acyl-CoA thioester hydrolase